MRSHEKAHGSAGGAGRRNEPVAGVETRRFGTCRTASVWTPGRAPAGEASARNRNKALVCTVALDIG